MVAVPCSTEVAAEGGVVGLTDWIDCLLMALWRREYFLPALAAASKSVGLVPAEASAAL